MEKSKTGLRAISALSGRAKAVLAALVILLAVLIAALCISNGMRARMQREYTAVRNQIGEALYSNLYILMQTFDMTGVPNADVQNAILPQMKNYFTASTTLNSLLGQAYGSKYTVLTDADINDVNNAFAAYETAYRNGTSTDLAQSDMQLCMGRIKELLNSRFSEGGLKPAR